MVRRYTSVIPLPVFLRVLIVPEIIVVIEIEIFRMCVVVGVVRIACLRFRSLPRCWFWRGPGRGLQRDIRGLICGETAAVTFHPRTVITQAVQTVV